MKPRAILKKARHRSRICLGLTGDLASGKSSVLKLFEKRKWKVISADAIVHEIYKEEGASLDQLRRECLKSEKNLRRLEKRIHPLVRKKVMAAIRETSKNCIVEIPLLFEAKTSYPFDAVIYVHAPKKDRKARAQRRGMSSSLFEFLNSRQWPSSKKALASDFVIWNQGSRAFLKKQVGWIANLFEVP